MTFTELKAKPGEYVYNKDGLVVGRINNDLTEDNRFTAFGACSIANGFIKASNLTPSDAKRFHNAVNANPNGYVLMGYTIALELKELPVEMWAVKAAEILDGEFEDLKEMLVELSKQPEKERAAKLSVLEKFFTKEKKQLQKKPALSPTAKKQVDEYFENWKENLDNCFSLQDAKENNLWEEFTFAYMVLIFLPHHMDNNYTPNWYQIWRKNSGTRARKTKELYAYFQSKLAEHLEDPMVPRRYRDVPYAQKLAFRYFKQKNNIENNKERLKEWQEERIKGRIDCRMVKYLMENHNLTAKEAVEDLKAFHRIDYTLTTYIGNFIDEHELKCFFLDKGWLTPNNANK